MDSSGLEAAIVEFPLPVRSCNFLDRPIDWLDLKNINIAFLIFSLSTGWNVDISGFEAAILDQQIPVTSYIISVHFIA